MSLLWTPAARCIAWQEILFPREKLRRRTGVLNELPLRVISGSNALSNLLPCQALLTQPECLGSLTRHRWVWLGHIWGYFKELYEDGIKRRVYFGVKRFWGSRCLAIKTLGKKPMSHIWVHESDVWLWLPSSAFCQCRPWQAAVMPQVIGFLSPVRDQDSVPSSQPQPLVQPWHCGHLGSESASGSARSLSHINKTCNIKKSLKSMHMRGLQKFVENVLWKSYTWSSKSSFSISDL